MKKKLFVLLLSIISVVCLAFGVSACSKTKTDDIAVTSVSISTTEISLEVGESYTLSATILPSNATNTNVTWSSSATSVATVSGGKVTAISEGTAVITVTTTDGGYTDTCTVTVTKTQETSTTVSVTSISLSETSLSLEAGGTYTLTATVLPSNATDKTITWSSSDESVATVNNGVITAVAAGTATITVTTTDGNYTATCELTITEEPEDPTTVAVTSVTLDKTTLALTVGDTYTLTATILPSNATNQNVTWTSSDNAIATVSNGVVTAVSTGTVTVNVTTEDGNYTANCEVTVTNPIIPINSVSLNTNSLSLTIGGSSTLIATILPSDATNQNVIWATSDSTIATISNGVVTAIAAGTATITVTTEDGNYTAECAVTVKEETPTTVSVTSVTLDKTSLNLDIGDTDTLTATILPSNATNQTVIWATSDDTVATISDGVVTAIAAGTATITVTTEDGGYNSTCTVIVSEPTILVTSVSLDKTTISLNIGDTSTLTATILPSNATNQNVTWSSSNTSVATINNGTITAVAAGTATITVTTEDGNHTAECEVTVTNPTILVNSISLDKTTLSLNIGESATLTDTILPSDATNQNVTWSSSNTSVATVLNGTITAVAAGTATITVTTEDGNHTATCTVSVAAATATILSVNNATINGSDIYLLVDYTTTSISLSGAVICSDNCGWKLYDTDGRTVIDTKVITSLADGANTYYIVATSTLDSTATNTYILTVYKSFAVTVSYYNGDNVIKTETVYTGYTYSADYTPDITGYTFNYWKTYDGQAYTATIILDNLNLYANTTAKTYTITYDANGGTVNETETAVTYDLSYTLAIPERTGYSFSGWYYGETQLTDENGNSVAVWNYVENIEVTAKWTANNYTVTLELSDSEAGSATGGGSYAYDSTVTITATTNSGYTWVGWYNGETLITTELSYTFVMGLDSTYTAKWTYYTVTTLVNDENAGSVTEFSDTKVTVGEKVTITATTNLGYTFVGWYKDDALLSSEIIYTFSMDRNNLTCAAKFEINSEMTNFEFTSTTTTCEITGIKNNTVTEIVVPDYVTSISEGAFSGCSKLVSITLPFIGGSLKTSSDTYQYPFGYIFGTTSYDGGTETKQYYYGSSISSSTNSTYYIPAALTTVTITGGNILYGAFYNCISLAGITIPDSVTSIGDSAFHGCSKLISITIPDGVTGIGSSAFSGCSKLISIVIPDSVTSIGSCVFYECTSLTNIIIGSGVTSIGNDAFNNCTAEIIWSDNIAITKIGTLVFADYAGNSITIPDSVTSIGDYAFSYCTSLTNVTMGSNLSTIGNYAFNNCSSLTNIIIPDSVTSIGNAAFKGCSNLESITLPFVGSSPSTTSATSSTLFGYIFGTSNYTGGTETKQYYSSSSYTTYYIPTKLTSVTITGGNIFYGAFYNCSSLTSITLSASVTSIGNSAFYNCSSLTNIYYNSSASRWASISFGNAYSNPLYYAGNLYLDGTSATEITLEGITSINAYAFYNCNSLTNITISDSVTNIGSSAFNGCSSLTNITISDSVMNIGSSAFKGCSSLLSITLPFVGDGSSNTNFGYIFGADSYSSNSSYVPKSLTAVIITGGSSVSSYAFYGCSKLTNITIGDSVMSIGDYAFYGCSSLTNIIIPDNVASIGNAAFRECTSLTNVTMGSSLSTIGNHAFFNCTSLTNVTMGSSLSTIGSYAFYDCSSLTNIIIPDNVTTIGTYAFNKCTSLTSVTIGSSLSTIGSYAFYNCRKLNVYYNGTASQWASISFENSPANPLSLAGNLYLNGTLATDITLEGITTVNAYAFYGCTSLTSVTIGSSVTSISKYAFYNCTSLTNITIPDSVTSIGNNAFENCTSLIALTIGSSIDTIGSCAFSGCYKLIEVYNLSSLTITAGSTDNGNVGYYAKNVHTSSEGISNLIELNDYIFYNDNGTYYLMGYIGTDTEITLPALTINGEVVSYSIYQYAFSDCSSLTSITISDNVTSIGNYAFIDCTSLTSVYYDGTVSQWISISFGNVSANPLYYAGNLYLNKILLTDLKGTDITTISPYSFAGWNITNITIPDSVMSIGADAFYKCTSLTNVTIGSNVTSIGSYAFYGCTSLTIITIPDSVISIGYQAFYGCSSLTSVTFENTNGWYYASSSTATSGTDVSNDDISDFSTAATYLTSTYASYYWHRHNYEAIVTEPTCTEQGYTTYTCSGCGDSYVDDYTDAKGHNYIATVTDPTCTEQGYTTYICSGCGDSYVDDYTDATGHNYIAIVTDPTCTEQGYTTYTCGGCGDSYVIDYTDATGHSYNDEGVCIGCGEVKGLMFELSSDNSYYIVKAIDDCTEATIIIPLTYNNLPVKEIASSAFYGNTDITSVTIGNNITIIGSFAFYGCTSLKEVVIPDSVITIENDAFNNCSLLETLSIGSNVESIGGSAFNGCYSLKTLVIPDSVITIGDNAFNRCTALTSVSIGNGVVTIGSSAFAYCTALTDITFGSNSKLETIGNSAFYCCSQLTSIIIPENVTMIDMYAFTSCGNLTSVTFKNTNGWYVTDTYGATSGTTLTETDLIDVSNAATLLKSTYYNYFWYRT